VEIDEYIKTTSLFRTKKPITYAPIELVGYKTLGMVEHYRGDLAVKEYLRK